MSVEILDGATIRAFVEDEQAFNKSVRDRFNNLDRDKDGFLSYQELLEELKNWRFIETHYGVDESTSEEELAKVYHSLFAQFDHDHNGLVDLQEFTTETKNMFLAMANGLGFLPIQMLVEEGSFLKVAVDRESSQVEA